MQEDEQENQTVGVTMIDDDFWSNRFHWCALAAGFQAARERKLDDSLSVRQIAYRLYESGAFRESTTTVNAD
jgi:hypothetical protein